MLGADCQTDCCFQVAGFLDKNNDTIHDELLQVLQGSDDPTTAALSPSIDTEKVAYGPSGGRFKSVSARFQTQLTELMATLNETSAHFIRCIKPNDLQIAHSFDSASVMTQLRCVGFPRDVRNLWTIEFSGMYRTAGVLRYVSDRELHRYSGMCAALRLLQAGFPTRISFEELHQRFKPRMPAILQSLKPITFCEAVLVALNLDGGRDFQMGLTK